MEWIIGIGLGIIFLALIIGRISHRSDERIRKMPEFLGPGRDDRPGS